ncbi:MAG: winged helix-turn-helix transcriptional regulator [Candidatus Wildermuthbacteria bacterium]|nr:winged helix-turn-helix transcriptional regulator [Candidatus Wildermuthbacteria bacterium]
MPKDRVLAADLQAETFFLDGLPIGFSERERALVLCLAQARGQFGTKSRIMMAVWGQEVREATLRKLVQKVRRRIGDDADNPRWIITEFGMGYRLKNFSPIESL